MNGTSPREEPRHTALSPQAKHAPIPPPPTAAVADDQVFISFFRNFSHLLTCGF